MAPLHVISTGACTPLGARAWQTAAAWHAGLSAFTRQAMTGRRTDRATVARVQAIEPECTGADRLLRLAAPALYEAMTADDGSGHAAAWPPAAPQAVFLAAPAAQGASGLPADAIAQAQRLALDLPRALDLAAEMLPLQVFAGGAVAGADALHAALRFMDEHPEAPSVLVGGVDSFCDTPVADRLFEQGLLRAGGHADGLIASEAAAFLRLARTAAVAAPEAGPSLALSPPAIRSAPRPRVGSRDTLDGAALIAATEQALAQAQMPADGLNAYWCDADGTPWRGSELASLSAALAPRGGMPPVTAPAGALGDVGAASLPLMLSLFHEQRQALHHPFMPLPAQGQAGVCALFSVSGHDARVAACLAAWLLRR
ncbi:MAG: 3-oxoacyl-ACP synthase [Proteobacteria bacterium]|nr:3-oxoacyl-ACP synthase [Pseudomonadota bacterium]